MYRLTITDQNCCPVTLTLEESKLLQYLKEYIDNISKESPNLTYKIIDIYRTSETEKLDFQDPKPAEGSQKLYTDSDDLKLNIYRLSILIKLFALAELDDMYKNSNYLPINALKVVKCYFLILGVCFFIGGLVASSPPSIVAGVLVVSISAIAFALVEDTSPINVTKCLLR